jgi:AraC family transcriptional regulator
LITAPAGESKGVPILVPAARGELGPFYFTDVWGSFRLWEIMIGRREILRQERVARVNRVMDYIRANLNGDLSLQALARVANFSPYHFHRTFRGVTGETVNGFIRRVRVETAAAKLVTNPALAITRVAVDCGFSSCSSFAREFRANFGMSASQFREGGFAAWSKIREAERKEGQAPRNGGKDAGFVPLYPQTHPNEDRRRSAMKMKVEVKEMPELHVAYARHVGPYPGIAEAINRIWKWASARRLLDSPKTLLLGVYHDNPEITEPAKLRSSACVTVPQGTKVDGEVGTMTIPGGRFAVAHCEITIDEYGKAWDKVIGEWIPQNGYQPDDDRMCYEIYLNDPDAHPEKKHIVDICEPVKPL